MGANESIDWSVFKVIEIRGLTKRFNGEAVLDSVSLVVKKGKIFGLVGRSGAGKSTLLRCINRLIPIDEGEVLVDRVDVASLSNQAIKGLRKNISMIFQSFSLLDRLSVYENIALPLRCWKYTGKNIERKTSALMEMVGIKAKADSKPAELSGGQKQRVAIARALTMDPKILLCDEATSALDPQTANAILSLLSDINETMGITMVIVTHQMQVLTAVCEDVAILEYGKVTAAGKVKDIFMEKPPALCRLIGDRDIVSLENGVNLELFLDRETCFSPVLSDMTRYLGIDCRIVGGEFANFRKTPVITLIINIPKKDIDRVVAFCRAGSIRFRPWKGPVPPEKGGYDGI